MKIACYNLLKKIYLSRSYLEIKRLKSKKKSNLLVAFGCAAQSPPPPPRGKNTGSNRSRAALKRIFGPRTDTQQGEGGEYKTVRGFNISALQATLLL
jgi:hypothetical protein